MECYCLKIVSDITEQRGELPFLVFGDFNARRWTANADECVIARLPDSVLNMDSDNETAQNQYRRESKDLYTNEIQTQKGSNERSFTFNTDTEYEHFVRNALYQATKQHLNDR